MKQIRRRLAFALPVILVAQAVFAEGEYKGIDEIVVTAQKRVSTVQDTAIAVTALDDEALEIRQIATASDLQFSVPNMLFSKSNFEGSNMAIRGVGNSAVAESSDPGVGVHINDIYLNESRVFETEFFDMERLEVLRGPQGTLHGRNTTAGVVNMITARPVDEFEAKILVDAGNYRSRKFNGMVNLPLSARVSTRLALYALDRGGYTENTYTGRDIDDRGLWSARSTTSFDLSDNTNITVMLSYFDEDDRRSRVSKQLCTKDTAGAFGLGCDPGSKGFSNPDDQATIQTALMELLTAEAAYAQATGGPARPFYADHAGLDGGAKLTFDFYIRPDILTPILLGAGLPLAAIDAGFDAFATFGFSGLGIDSFEDSINPSDMRKVHSDFDPEYDTDETIISIEVSHEVNDITIQSMTAWQKVDYAAYTDYDWAVPSVNYITPVPWQLDGRPQMALFDSGVDLSGEESDQWSQQFTLLSHRDGKFNWTAGAYYMEFESTGTYSVFSSGLAAYAAAGGLSSIVETVFGVPAAPLPAEQSYYNNYTEYQVTTWALFGEGYYDFSDDTRLTVGVRYSDETKQVNAILYYVDLADSFGDPMSDQENDWQEVTGKIGIDHNAELRFTDETLLYATGARGYKGGGFNPPASTPGLYSETFDPEYINSFEVGMKNRLLDGRVQLNLAAFYFDYEGLQVSQIIDQSGINENIDAEIIGVEIETMIAPSANWLFGLNLAWLEAEVGKFSTFDSSNPQQGAPVINIFGNLSSAIGADPVLLSLKRKELVNAPDFSVNFFADYTSRVENGTYLRLHVDYYYQSDYFVRNFNTAADRVAAWDVSNAFISLNSEAGNWSVRAWVKNIQDDDNITGHYTTDAVSALFTNVFVLEPRTYGLTFAKSF